MKNSNKTKTTVDVTVCILTYNGQEYIERILRSLFAQKTAHTYEILVIDSGSTDATLDIIKKFKGVVFHQISNKEFGHGKTRNYAAQLARGTYVAYLTHDAIPAHNKWLDEMIRPFEINDKIVGVTGKQIPRAHCFPLLKYEINSVFSGLGPDFGTTIFYKDEFVKDQGTYDAISFYSDANSASRRDYLLGKFPYQDVAYAEDQLFGRDVIDAGYYKVYAPRASVEHSNDLTLRQYKHRMFDETLGLRKIGIPIGVPSLKTIIKLIAKGVPRDAVKTITDRQYSFKRKVYWLFMNPFYHVEKWRGVRRAARANPEDSVLIEKYSLEKRSKLTQGR